VPDPRVRRKARERAVQFLFGLDFTQYAWESVIDAFFVAHTSRPSVKQYARRLIRGVCENQQAIDNAIDNAIRNWSPDRVGRVERSILRVALFEIWYVHDEPAPVAINEAIEVAKRFGANDAPRFINGVLDRLRGSPVPEGTIPGMNADDPPETPDDETQEEPDEQE